MKKKKWYRVLAAVLAAIVLFSSFMVIRELLTKQKEKKDFPAVKLHNMEEWLQFTAQPAAELRIP